MLLKQHVNIAASLFGAYAHLRYTVSFFNEDKVALAPSFAFSLPRGAAVSDFQVYIGEKKLLRAKLSAAEAGLSQDDAVSARLTRTGETDYELTLSHLSAEGTVKLLVTAYAPLVSEERTARLVIPNPAAWADIQIEVMDKQWLFALNSPTHAMTAEADGVASLSSGAVPKDIVIEAVYRKVRKSTAYFMRMPSNETLGYYQLCLPETTARKNTPQMFFLLDCTAGMLGGRLAAAKDAILAALQECGEKQNFRIAALGRQITYFYPEAVPATLENLRSAVNWLKGIKAEGGTISDAITPFLDEIKKPDVLPILLTSADMNAWSQLARTIADSGLNIVTFGTHQPNEMAGAVAKIAGGRACHIFPQNGFETAAARTICNLLRPNPDKYEIQAEPSFGGEVYRLTSAGNVCTLIAKGSGALPKKFFLSNGDGLLIETIVEEAAWFEGFDLLRLLYGEACLRELRRLRCQASPASWRSIQRQIQRISLESGLLSEETVFVVEWEGEGLSQPIPFRIEAEAPHPTDDFSDRASRFLTPEDDVLALYSAENASSVLLMNVRVDGAIADGSVCDIEMRTRQTAYALLALCKALKGKTEYKPVIEDAAVFLLEKGNVAESLIKSALYAALDMLRWTVIHPRIMAVLDGHPPQPIEIANITEKSRTIQASKMILMRG